MNKHMPDATTRYVDIYAHKENGEKIRTVLRELEHIRRHLAARERRIGTCYKFSPDFEIAAVMLASIGHDAGGSLAQLVETMQPKENGEIVEFTLAAGERGVQISAITTDADGQKYFESIEKPFPRLISGATLGGLFEIVDVCTKLSARFNVSFVFRLLESNGLSAKLQYFPNGGRLVYGGLFGNTPVESQRSPTALILSPDNPESSLEVALTPYFDVIKLSDKSILEDVSRLPVTDIVVLAGWNPEDDCVAEAVRKLELRGSTRTITIGTLWQIKQLKQSEHWDWIREMSLNGPCVVSWCTEIKEFQALAAELAAAAQESESKKAAMLRRGRLDDFETKIRDCALQLVGDYIRLRKKALGRTAASVAPDVSDALVKVAPYVENLCAILPPKNGISWSPKTLQDWCRAYGKEKPLFYLNNAVVEHIKRLVDQDDYAQDELVELLDVWTKQTMRKQFSAHTGMTIESYRGTRKKAGLA